MFRKIYQGRNTVFSRHVCQELTQEKFLGTLVKDNNSKKKNNDSRNYTNSNKIPWLPKMDQKL